MVDAALQELSPQLDSVYAPVGRPSIPPEHLLRALLFGVRFFRAAPIYDPTPLDPNRRFGALLALLVFVLCFMANPL